MAIIDFKSKIKTRYNEGIYLLQKCCHAINKLARAFPIVIECDKHVRKWNIHRIIITARICFIASHYDGTEAYLDCLLAGGVIGVCIC